uniref:Putative secreted protein n=1 Tax=Rhipicephalus microplus TaxID=6941 RepID=A0A6G5A3P6_RHIMP
MEPWTEGPTQRRLSVHLLLINIYSLFSLPGRAWLQTVECSRFANVASLCLACERVNATSDYIGPFMMRSRPFR